MISLLKNEVEAYPSFHTKPFVLSGSIWKGVSSLLRAGAFRDKKSEGLNETDSEFFCTFTTSRLLFFCRRISSERAPSSDILLAESCSSLRLELTRDSANAVAPTLPIRFLKKKCDKKRIKQRKK